MTHNLENKLKSLSGKIEKGIAQAHKISEKEREKIQAKCNREISQINEKYNSLVKEVENYQRQQIESLKEEYGAEIIYSQLTKDYNEMQIRSDISSAQEYQEAAKIALKISSLGETGEQALESAKSLVEIFGNTKMGEIEITKDLLRLIEHIKNGGYHPETIKSYTAQCSYNSVPTLNLIVPIDGENNKQLSQDLEDKILDTVLNEKLQIGSNISLGGSGSTQVEGFNLSEVQIEGDEYLINGYRVFQITPKNYKEITAVEKGIIRRLEELQPKSFKHVNLTHRVLPISCRIADYFMNHSMEEFHSNEINMEPKNVQTNSKRLIKRAYEYASYPNPESAKEEAMKRLENINAENLTAKDIQHILGLSSPSSAGVFISYHQKELSPNKKEGLQLIKRENILKFINSRKPNKNGWMKN